MFFSSIYNEMHAIDKGISQMLAYEYMKGININYAIDMKKIKSGIEYK